MGDKSEKERRKQLLNQVRQKEREDFDKSLPMSRDNFKSYLIIWMLNYPKTVATVQIY